MATSGSDSKDSAGYSVPDIWNFPPMFTLQPVDATRTKQLEQWKDIIVGWHKAHRADVLDVNTWALFENRSISRKVNKEMALAIAEYLIVAGHGDWEDTSKSRCRVYWKSLQDWANAIYDWAAANAMIGSVYTVFELHSGEVAQGAEFYGLDAGTVTKALRRLEAAGKAVVFAADSPEDLGVKFLPTTA